MKNVQMMPADAGASGGTGDSGAGGGAPDWRASLAPEIRDDPSLKNIADVPSLAKGYVHAQRLVGQERIPAPRADWKDADWAAHWNRLGRPEAPNGYKKPENLKLEDGLKLDDAKLGRAFERFHQMGLSARQAEQMVEFYAGVLNEGVVADRDRQKAELDTATAALRQKFGDKFDAKLDLARSVIQKFGGEGADAFIQYLESKGLANDPRMVEFMASVGDAMMEDHARDGTSRSLFVRDGTQALAEIESLSLDAEFQKALSTRQHAGHRAALEKWERLHRIAYPGKVTG